MCPTYWLPPDFIFHSKNKVNFHPSISRSTLGSAVSYLNYCLTHLFSSFSENPFLSILFFPNTKFDQTCSHKKCVETIFLYHNIFSNFSLNLMHWLKFTQLEPELTSENYIVKENQTVRSVCHHSLKTLMSHSEALLVSLVSITSAIKGTGLALSYSWSE